MNERIETLAKAAGYDMINKAAMRALGFDVEKFAQLIIEECLRMCDCADVSLLEHNRPQEASGASSVKQFIAEHFGVEE